MKTKAIIASNIDDYIRERKRKGTKKILWNKKNWSILKRFFQAVSPCIHGWACICGEGTLRGFKEGMNFMGIKHYKRN